MSSLEFMGNTALFIADFTVHSYLRFWENSEMTYTIYCHTRQIHHAALKSKTNPAMSS